jgi:4-hydroxy-tetrahydrodipicolinate synthase
MDLSGAIPPIITPKSNTQSEVNSETLSSFTQFLVEGGVHALFPCGSIGEFSSLDRTQRMTVVKTVIENADGTPVLAGCGGTSVPAVTESIADAEAVGADAAVIVTPYYLNADDDGLAAFYESVADRASIPILLYDIPSLAGNELTVEIVARLATHPEIIGIKDSTGDIIHHQRLIEATPDSFDVFQGMAELAVPALDIGADGFVAGPANVYPNAAATTYDAYRSGDRAEAVELWQEVLNPVVAATRPSATAAGLKYLLERHGRDVGEPFLPLTEPSDAQMQVLDRCYDRLSERRDEIYFSNNHLK